MGMASAKTSRDGKWEMGEWMNLTCRNKQTHRGASGEVAACNLKARMSRQGLKQVCKRIT